MQVCILFACVRTDFVDIVVRLSMSMLVAGASRGIVMMPRSVMGRVVMAMEFGLATSIGLGRIMDHVRVPSVRSLGTCARIVMSMTCDVVRTPFEATFEGGRGGVPGGSLAKLRASERASRRPLRELEFQIPIKFKVVHIFQINPHFSIIWLAGLVVSILDIEREVVGSSPSTWARKYDRISFMNSFYSFGAFFSA